MQLTWNEHAKRGECPGCDGVTVLVVAPITWEVDEESVLAGEYPDGIEVNAEVTGHWCDECQRLVSISVNQ